MQHYLKSCAALIGYRKNQRLQYERSSTSKSKGKKKDSKGES